MSVTTYLSRTGDLDASCTLWDHGAAAPKPSNVSTPNAGLSISAESNNWGDSSVTVGSDVVFSFDDNDD